VYGLRSLAIAILVSIGTVRGQATLMFRVSQSLGRAWAPLGHLAKQLNHFVTGADLAWQAEIGPGLVLYHPTGVVIGPHVRSGSGLVLQQGVTIGGDGGATGGRGSSPTLGQGVQVGAGARIFGAVRVGDGAVIGANAVVVHDVPADSVAVGVPAVVRPKRSPLPSGLDS
jgi:serine O-acetyltransferase